MMKQKNTIEIDWDKNDIEITHIVFWGAWHKRKENDNEASDISQWLGNEGGMKVRWSKPNIGFGEATFWKVGMR